MCRPLFVKASWEQGYILPDGVCMLWSSLQPVWVLVCHLLGSCRSAAGGVVEEWYRHSAEWVSCLCSGPWAFQDLAVAGLAAIHQVYKPGMASRVWGVSCSEDIPAFLHSAEWKCKAWATAVAPVSTCCDPSCRWAALPTALRGESWWGNKWVVKWGGWVGRWEHDLEGEAKGE